ncbi:MAG: hypothetical protein KIG36_01140 [Eubacteriales bacterium]|nr:hypothetical protein [Eubacteriales bacterium]
MDEKSGKGKIQFFALKLTFLIVGLIGALIMTAVTVTGRTYSWMTINVFIYALGAALLFFLEDKNDGVGMLTILMVAAVQALRCVVLPVTETLTDNFAEYSYIYTFEEACRLTVWEQAVIWAASLCVAKVKLPFRRRAVDETIADKKPALSGWFPVYLVLLAIALALVPVLNPEGKRLFSFFLISDDGGRVIEESALNINILRSMINIALDMLTVGFIVGAYQAYCRNEKPIFVLLAVLVAVTRMSIITGERRQAVLCVMLALLYLLCRLFSKHWKKILLSMAVAGGIIIGLMSIYKFYYAFLYSSYAEAWEAGGGITAKQIVGWIDDYFFGLETVTKNMRFSTFPQVHIGFEQLLIDIGRDIFGIHFLFGGMPTTVNYYNLLIYNGAKDTGWLFSSIGYGYMYLGGFFAPVFTIINFIAAVLFERLLHRTVNAEPVYIVGYVYTRIILNVFGSFPGTLNNISQYMTLAGLVLLAAWFAKKAFAGRKARRLTEQGRRQEAAVADRRK